MSAADFFVVQVERLSLLPFSVRCRWRAEVSDVREVLNDDHESDERLQPLVTVERSDGTTTEHFGTFTAFGFTRRGARRAALRFAAECYGEAVDQ